MMRHDGWNYSLSLLTLLFACQPRTAVLPSAEIDASQQVVVVVTPSWTSTTGTMTRFERATPTSAWNRIEAPIPLVVGRTGIAWGVGFDNVSSDGPHKHEGDGKAPAGMFPLDTAFGFAPRDSMQNVRLPYVQLRPTTDCVDDTNWLEYKKSGELWDNEPGGKHHNTATVTLTDGVWKVSSFTLEVKGTC